MKTRTRVHSTVCLFRLPVELDTWLKESALRDHTTKSAIIRALIIKAMRADKARS